jgi:hypothetical protein
MAITVLTLFLVQQQPVDAGIPIQPALDAFTSHHWLALAVIVIGYLVRLTAPDSKFPITIPDRWKPLVVLVLAQAYAVLVAIQGGVAVKTAIIHGVMTWLVTLGVYDVIIKAIFNGVEPKWLKYIAFVPKAIRELAPSAAYEAAHDEKNVSPENKPAIDAAVAKSFPPKAANDADKKEDKKP